MEWLEKVIHNMHLVIAGTNRYFWPALMDPGEHLSVSVNGYMMRTVEETQFTLQQCYNSWAESPGAIAYIAELQRNPEVQRKLAEILEG